MRDSDNKPHFEVTAGIIRREGKVLITRRPEGSHLAGYWEFPGGKQEKPESLEACLRREIKEELGLEVRVEERIFSIPHEYDQKTITLHVFRCTGGEGPPETLEGQEMRWVAPRDLINYTFPPPDREILGYLTSGMSTSDKCS